MDEILAIELVKQAFSRLVRCFCSDLIAPFDCANNVGAFLTIKYSWPFMVLDFCVAIGPHYQSMHYFTGLSNGVKMTRVAQIKATVNISSQWH